jgi:ferritin
MITDLYGLAIREIDYASRALLQWFMMEQVGDKSETLFLLDRELGLLRSAEYASQAGEA